MAQDAFHTEMMGDVPFTILKRYHVIRKIGVGSLGQLVSANDSIRNEKVAIKKYLKCFSADSNAKLTYREIYLMKHLKHPNIISMLNIFTPNMDAVSLDDIYVVMDLARCNLATLIRKIDGRPLDHGTLQRIVYQMLSPVHYMHLCGVAQTNLKPQNIVVKFDKEGERVESIKLTDFGFARSMFRISRNQNMGLPYAMTFFYEAPEVILGLPLGCAADIWSIGSIMAELILGCQALKGHDLLDQWDKICEVRGTPEEEYFSHLVPNVRDYCRRRVRQEGIPLEELLPDSRFECHTSEQVSLNPLARDLIGGLLQIQEEKRIKLDQALNHPYLKDWINPNDVDPEHPLINEDIMDLESYTKKGWKELVWSEIHTFVQPPVTPETPQHATPMPDTAL